MKAQLKTVSILGTAVNVVGLDQGLGLANQAMTASSASYIVLPNVEFIHRAHRDPRVQSALDQAYLRLPNGVALTWAAQYLYGGRPSLGRLVTTGAQIVLRPARVQQILPNRFDSSNFTMPLLRQAAIAGQAVFLVGSPKCQSINAACAYLAASIPGLVIAGSFTGQLDAAKEQELVAKLRATKPALILIGMGFPRQELLMQRLVSQLDQGLMIGEGGSFDYQNFGGHIRRAPAWVRQIGLEWLWRLIREPQRLVRQQAIPSFIWSIYWEGRRQLR